MKVADGESDKFYELPREGGREGELARRAKKLNRIPVGLDHSFGFDAYHGKADMAALSDDEPF